MPLTFIVGIYGMNFKFMPELSTEWGYPAVWATIIIITAIMLFYFKKRKWI
jgi:magnesium transporter